MSDATHCKCTQKMGLHHNPVCSLHGLVTADNYIPHAFGVSPWHPMSDTVDLKTMGKAMEELGECIAAISRCIIQGIDELEPVTGKCNRDWLQEEMADVYANFMLIEARFNVMASTRRIERKMADLRAWHKLA